MQNLFQQILSYAVMASDFLHAQGIQCSFGVAQGHSYGRQQAPVKTRGADMAVIVNLQRGRGILRPDLLQVDPVLVTKIFQSNDGQLYEEPM